jgi:hypothetical protein
MKLAKGRRHALADERADASQALARLHHGIRARRLRSTTPVSRHDDPSERGHPTRGAPQIAAVLNAKPMPKTRRSKVAATVVAVKVSIRYR